MFTELIARVEWSGGDGGKNDLRRVSTKFWEMYKVNIRNPKATGCGIFISEFCMYFAHEW